MPTFLEIAVNVPQVSGVFHYHLPPELEGEVRTGHLVVVPFGHRKAQGVVLRAIETPAVASTRPVQRLLDSEPVITSEQIQLAEFLAETTLAPIAACVALMLPPGLSQQADTLYTLAENVKNSEKLADLDLSDLQERLVKLLKQRGSLRGRQIDRALPRVRWRRSADALSRRDMLLKKPVLPPPSVQPKQIRTARLAVPPQKAAEQMNALGHRESTQTRREAMLRFLMKESGPVNVSWVYAASDGNMNDLRILADKGLVVLGETEVWRDPLEEVEFVASQPLPLTADQKRVWKHIERGIQKASQGKSIPPYLIHGVTGSGKTELYLQAVAEILRLGKQAIVLVPEIALTPQTVRRFLSRFPGEVGLVHSQLSQGERYDTWRRAREGALSVIVGPRSALFTPLPYLGLIVVDESHDNSYYQSEMPHYHAREASIEYARLCGAVCMMGSATPDVASYFRAKQSGWQLLELPARILAHKEAIQAQLKRLEKTKRASGRRIGSQFRPFSEDAETTELPPVRIVDMREELKAGNRSIFSRALHKAMGEVLDRGEQAILFLNRRGTATYVFCRDCGYAMKCPRCDDIPLTYHQPENALICHHCGYQRRMPKTCPECGGNRIRHYGTGTERVEQEVEAHFPGTRTLRWDWETTRKKGTHDVILSHFSNHLADVLVGTQMLAKGLDLPWVTLVGVVLADVGLNLPDYLASERTFQVLSQVAGRAGRSPLGGEVVLQTFEPDHYVIQAVSKHDYGGFYKKELGYRKELGYPPYRQLVRLEYRHTNPDQAASTAQSLAASVTRWMRAEKSGQTEMIGPAPCFYKRLDGQYRWQILLRGQNPAALIRDKKLTDWRVEVNPQGLL